MDHGTVLKSDYSISPCYQDLVTYTIGHNRYDDTEPVLIDASDSSHSITLETARTLVQLLITALYSHGIKEGDTVCIHMFNSILYPMLFLAVVGSGARVAASNPASTSTELARHLQLSDANLVITSADYVSAMQQAIAKVKDCESPPRTTTISDLLDAAAGVKTPWLAFDNKEKSASTIATLNTTSGTTGLPKLAARSHYSLVTENLAIEDFNGKPYEVRRLLCTPFFHAFTMPLAVISALRFGHLTYVMSRFDQSAFLSAVHNFHITETAMPPPMLIRFMAMTESARASLKGLQLVWSGGAPMSSDTQARANSMFADDSRISQVWGMTEGGWMTTFQYPESDDEGSVGRLISTYEAKIVPVPGDDRSDVDGISAGEILIRGPINMIGYFNNPSATSDIYTTDGWLHTGDIGYASKDGRIFIVDRLKELIKVRGWQVAPAEIEARLLTHPGVVDAGVIGIPKPEQATEVPKAYVVLRHQGSVTAEEIKSYLLSGLAKYKVSECQVEFVAEIPKSPSGKILRKVLRERFARGV